MASRRIRSLYAFQSDRWSPHLFARLPKKIGNQRYRRLRQKVSKTKFRPKEVVGAVYWKWKAISKQVECSDRVLSLWGKRNRWHLDKLKRHKPVSELKKQDQDQQQRKHNLENLLSKSNQFPPVSLTAGCSLVLVLVRDRYSVSYF